MLSLCSACTSSSFITLNGSNKIRDFVLSYAQRREGYLVVLKFPYLCRKPYGQSWNDISLHDWVPISKPNFECCLLRKHFSLLKCTHSFFSFLTDFMNNLSECTNSKSTDVSGAYLFTHSGFRSLKLGSCDSWWRETSSPSSRMCLAVLTFAVTHWF